MYCVIFDYFDLPQYRFFNSYEEVSTFLEVSKCDGSISRIFVRQLLPDEANTIYERRLAK